MAGSTAHDGETRRIDESAVESEDDVTQSLMRTIGGRPAWLLTAGVAILGGGAALVGAATTLPPWARYAPLAVSLLVFGLPHGAVDHLAPARAAGEQPSVRWLLIVGLVYLLLGGAYAVLWLLSPIASAAFFIGMTWVHWGQGDLYALEALGGSHLDSRAVRTGTLLVRGGLPMLVPLLRFPERYRDVVDAWVALFGGSLDASWLVAPDVRLSVGAAFAALTVGTLLAGYRRSPGDGWRLDAAETGLLWVYFLVVPPILAIGVYFCVWHSLRHIARLVGVDPSARRAFADRGAVPALLRTGRDALPLTVVSVGLLVGVALVGRVQTDLQTLAALYLVFIAVLTLPHVVIVTWMDRTENAGLAGLVREQ
ncbi:Brp/Blh family beta-carotene 15,15'-dioxygenase [Halobellus inordinatus]|uniref:Brp/Blh family beta-carotene 15,15'-dioxygenase n=1 Tax=Halobellus inordinatus TaxID=1126236 RepID=UPI0021152E54|nr:Brp/Blh family beta-carotene 15,15'-dioxygenase [Halobellus ramosii]